MRFGMRLHLRSNRTPKPNSFSKPGSRGSETETFNLKMQANAMDGWGPEGHCRTLGIRLIGSNFSFAQFRISKISILFLRNRISENLILGNWGRVIPFPSRRPCRPRSKPVFAQAYSRTGWTHILNIATFHFEIEDCQRPRHFQARPRTF